MWTSKSKQLNKYPDKPQIRFETEETTLLISLWGDLKVQRALITSRKKQPIMVKLSEQMKEYGYIRSFDEIYSRIHNLKRFYSRLKKKIKPGTKPLWKHYAAMEEILTRNVFGNNAQQQSLNLILPEKTENIVATTSTTNFDLEDESSRHVETVIDVEGSTYTIKEAPLNTQETEQSLENR